MTTHMKPIDLSDTELFKKLHLFNLIKRMREEGFLERTYRFNDFTGMIEPLLYAGVDTKTPWVHVNQDPERDCDRLHMMEAVGRFIPTKCLDCWKVVVKPKTLLELFQLYNMQVAMNQEENVYCKCGIEIGRPYVHALYGGYFYNPTKKTGLERYKQVRQLVNDWIGDDIPVILKRYCTEFEIKHGPSKGYNQPKSAIIWEDLFEKHVVKIEKALTQHELLARDAMEKWIHFADMNADPTITMFNEHEHIFQQPQTYHEENHA